MLARQDRIELAAGQTLTLDADVLDGLAPGTAEATVAIGPLAAFDVPGLLTALEAYPWGCTEQTVSRAMPLLYFAATAEGLGIAARGRDRASASTTAIRDVLANQTGAGGFGLWSAEASGDGWLDAYVTDFLSRARAQGHAVPDRAFESALGNLANLVNAYGDFEKGGEDLAYALMVLAREGRAAIGDLRYYADTRARSLRDAARPGPARRRPGARRRPAARRRDVPPRRPRGARRASPSSSSAPTTAAARATPPACWRSPPRPAATPSTAQALTGIVTAPGAERSTQEQPLDAARRARAGRRRRDRLDRWSTTRPRPARRCASRRGDLPLRVTNAGPEPTLAVVTAFGVPTQPEPAQGNGYRIERQLLTLDGAPADPAAIALNDRLVAVVTVTPERDLQARLIVSDPLPAGLEIENPNLLRSGETGQLAWLAADDVATHTEFRADRFAAAVDWQGAAALPPRLHGARRLARQLPPPGRERRGHVPPGLPRPHRRRHA